MNAIVSSLSRHRRRWLGMERIAHQLRAVDGSARALASVPQSWSCAAAASRARTNTASRLSVISVCARCLSRRDQTADEISTLAVRFPIMAQVAPRWSAPRMWHVLSRSSFMCVRRGSLPPEDRTPARYPRSREQTCEAPHCPPAACFGSFPDAFTTFGSQPESLRDLSARQRNPSR
jgi:hypothetical protein